VRAIDENQKPGAQSLRTARQFLLVTVFVLALGCFFRGLETQFEAPPLGYAAILMAFLGSFIFLVGLSYLIAGVVERAVRRGK
jgi:hypothetical protein